MIPRLSNSLDVAQKYSHKIIMPCNHFWLRGVFRALSNVLKGVFCKYRGAVSYFRKTFYLSCLAGFWIRLLPLCFPLKRGQSHCWKVTFFEKTWWKILERYCLTHWSMTTIIQKRVGTKIVHITVQRLLLRSLLLLCNSE